jgi:hypothetical protein
MNHRQGKAGSDSGIDCVSASLHNLNPGPRSQFVNTNHDGMGRMDGLRGRDRG